MSTRERLLALDVFRGMTVAGMLLVNNPGTWSAIYPPLEHAPWNGWTPTDLIFPFFLFIVGITTELSLSARRARGSDDRAILTQIVKRASLIFLFGLILSAFPFFSGTLLPTMLDRRSWIALFIGSSICGYSASCSASGWRICLARSHVRTTTGDSSWDPRDAAVRLLGTHDVGACAGHGRRRTLRAGQAGSAVERVAGSHRAWSESPVGGSKTWDPEGLLSTLPAIGTMMLGTFAGRWIGDEARPLSERLTALFAVGALLMMAGLMWNWWLPDQQEHLDELVCSVYGRDGIGRVSHVSLGDRCLPVATLDVSVRRIWDEPDAGIPRVRFDGTVDGQHDHRGRRKRNTHVSLQGFLFDRLYVSWLPLREASFAYAVSFVVVWFLILWAAWKRGVVLKV